MAFKSIAATADDLSISHAFHYVDEAVFLRPHAPLVICRQMVRHDWHVMDDDLFNHRPFCL